MNREVRWYLAAAFFVCAGLFAFNSLSDNVVSDQAEKFSQRFDIAVLESAEAAQEPEPTSN